MAFYSDAFKHSPTFLRHVVHAVGHRGALLLGVQGGEASVVVHKVVVCEKKQQHYNKIIRNNFTQRGFRVLLFRSDIEK